MSAMEPRQGGEAVSGAGGVRAAAPPARAAAVSSEAAAAFGKLVAVMMASPMHRHLALDDLPQRLMPALAANQFVVADGQVRGIPFASPIGMLLWAKVDDAVDARLAADTVSDVALAPHEWTCGENLWLMEAIGGASVLEAMLRRLIEGPFAGRSFRLRRRGGDGLYVCETIDLAQG